jgi:hypothetical protein
MRRDLDAFQVEEERLIKDAWKVGGWLQRRIDFPAYRKLDGFSVRYHGISQQYASNALTHDELKGRWRDDPDDNGIDFTGIFPTIGLIGDAKTVSCTQTEGVCTYPEIKLSRN